MGINKLAQTLVLATAVLGLDPSVGKIQQASADQAKKATVVQPQSSAESREKEPTARVLVVIDISADSEAIYPDSYNKELNEILSKVGKEKGKGVLCLLTRNEEGRVFAAREYASATKDLYISENDLTITPNVYVEIDKVLGSNPDISHIIYIVPVSPVIGGNTKKLEERYPRVQARHLTMIQIRTEHTDIKKAYGEECEHEKYYKFDFTKDEEREKFKITFEKSIQEGFQSK